MESTVPYHFSKKVLFLSVIFVLINLAFYAVVFLSSTRDVSPREIAPTLLFATTQRIELSSPYIPEVIRARPKQKVLAGTTVRTTAQAFAELSLENNVIRLDQNTELKLILTRFPDRSVMGYNGEPRLTFELLRGTVWVNAFDSIAFVTPRSRATFRHTVGSVTYNAPLNRIIAVRGNINVDLKNDTGSKVASYIVPLNSQIIYSDTQITDAYALLEHSKLRKELKASLIPESVMSDEWIVRNTRDDEQRFVTDANYVFSESAYSYKSRYLKFRERWAFVPRTVRKLRLDRARLILNYLLGGVHERGDVAQANRLLKELNTLSADLENDPAFIGLIESQFYAIYHVPFKSPAYFTKNNLRNMLARIGSPEIFRTYFTDLDYFLRANNLEAAGDLASAWLDKWDASMRSRYYAEFENQSRLFNRVLIAHADVVDSALLAQFDKSGDMRIAQMEGDSETIFEVSQERLSVVRFMVAAQRYSDAKNYLRTSYESLNIAGLNKDIAARDVFLEEASLIAGRIEFAQEFLHGSAGSVDESEFKNFLLTRKRDEKLSLDLSSFLSDENKVDIANNDIFDSAFNDSQSVEPAPEVLPPESAVSDAEELPSDISTFITEDDESLRQQIVSQDLAVQLLITELLQAGVTVSKNDIKVMDVATLTNFHVESAEVTDPKNLSKPIKISFDYDLSAKLISNIKYLNADAVLSGSFLPDGFDMKVLEAVYFEENRRESLDLIKKEFKLLHLDIDPLSIAFIGDDLVRFTFDSATLDTVPITISGEFDRSTKKFISAKHRLYNANDVSVETYLSKLVTLYTIDYLSSNGISVDQNNLIADFPYDRLRVTGYEQNGRFYDFTVDINSNLLRNIVLQGSEASVESMTIQDFKDL